MKKILFFITFICLSAISIGQSGTGWGNINYKMNHKDSVNFVKSFRIGNIQLTPSATQLNYLDIAAGRTGTTNLVYSNSPVLVTPNIGTATGSVSGNAGTVTNGVYTTDTALMLTPYLNHNDTATMLLPYMREAEVNADVVLKVNISDTASMLSKYLHKLNPSPTGTVTLPATTSIGDVDATEIENLNGSTSNIQDQLNDTVGIWSALDTISIGTIVAESVVDSLNSLGILKADSTGNAEGNYMTRQNYHNDATAPSILKTVQGFGSTLKALPVVAPYAFSSMTLTDARAYFILIYIPEKITITGVKFTVGSAQGDYNADQTNQVGLYSCSGTTYTLVAESANNGNLFKGAIGAVTTEAFTAPYDAAPGYYYIAILWNTSDSPAATVPTIYATNINAVLNSSFSDSKVIAGYNATENELAASYAAGDLTILSTIPYSVLY